MKTNRYILSLLLLVVSAFNLLPANAQQNQYAIYNYRNDGDFNAWLNIDVDSITYSCTDTLGVEHDDVVVQEVWTPDSVYRIPISAIDSLAFRAPKPEYRDNVFHITEEHLPYIIAVDDYSITFSTSLPQSLRPQVGQTIVSDTFEKPLEDGFAGKVEQIDTNGNELVFLCGQASIIDVFKKFVLVGKAVSENPANISKAAPRKGWFDDPWITVEEQGIKQIDIPTDLELEILGGVFGVKSKDPQLTLGYYFYLDDVIYSFSADAYLNHKDLSFTTAFKLSDFMKVAESGSEYLTNFILGKGDEKEAEEKWYEHEFDDLKFKIPFHVGPVNFSIELAPVFKLKGDVELDVIQKTSARQHIGFRKSGYTAALVANPFISLLLGDMSYNYVQDPMRSQQLTAKMKGSATMGLSLQLKVNLVSKNVAHAAIGAEYDRKLSGNLQFNLYDTEQQPSSFYDVIKDSKIKVEDYVKIKGEIGVSPLKFLSLSGSFEIPVKEWGEYHLVPHFTKPELPTYSMGHWTYKNPMSLYSTVSKDILLECKPGLKIVDTEGNLVKEYISTDPYQDEVAWSSTPLEMNLEQLTPNTTYKCYPTFSMFGLKPFAASPSYEFTVPCPVSLETKELTLQIGKSHRVAINGGWGDYSLGHLNKTACDAELKKDGDNYDVQLLGKAKGLAPITVNDLRSGESTTLRVNVTEEEVENLALSETSLAMETNGTAEVAITSGSGSYTVANSDEAVAVAAISNGNKVVIAARKAGTATITVTDTETQQTATIEVTVTDGGNDDYPIDGEVTKEQYEAAKSAIEQNGRYKIFTRYNGKSLGTTKYYLMADGHLTADESKARTFVFGQVTGSSLFVTPGWKLDVPFTNPSLSNGATGDLLPHGYIRTDSQNRNDWEGQVWYKNGDRYAVRSTNATGNTWGANTYWTALDSNTDGLPEADYSLTPKFIWQLEQSLILSATSVYLIKSDTRLIEITSGSGNYTLENSDASVVTAAISNGNEILIAALKAGTATITVTDTKTKQTATIAVTVTEGENPPTDEHEYVDLGLPSGTLWATCNVGATKPEEYGDYFAWGETTPKENYRWSTYKYGGIYNLTKYCNQSYYGNNGFTDNKEELDIEDDAAYVNWGGDWRIPSVNQIKELIYNCNWEWTQLNGVNGRKVTGPNGNSIFLPHTGWRDGTSHVNAGSYGTSWSRSLTSPPDYVYVLRFWGTASGTLGVEYDNFYNSEYNGRALGRSVRPVRQK